jgi:F420-nonreducing hydrogenase I cytochrome b subunit
VIPVNTVRVLRHNLFFRLLHWAIFIEGVFLALTGMQMGGILGVTLFPSETYSYHVSVAFVFIASAILLVYEMFVSRSYGWVRIRRIPYSFKYILGEAKAWFGLGPPMKEPIAYDAVNKRYKEKLIPSVIVVWWSFVALGLVFILTGLALAFPAQFSIVYMIADPIGIALTSVGGFAFMLAVHRIATYLLVILVVMHVYASFLFKLVQSAIFGYRQEPIEATREIHH